MTSGRADVVMSKDGQPPARVRILEAPDFFGEMGMMTGEPRSASVVAVSDVECFRLDKAGFQKIITQRPEIAAKISETLAQRRVDLIAMREGLDADAKLARQKSEQERILERIQSFFGLSA
jgi:CRP-like cAMP-binding protein